MQVYMVPVIADCATGTVELLLLLHVTEQIVRLDVGSWR